MRRDDVSGLSLLSSIFLALPRLSHSLPVSHLCHLTYFVCARAVVTSILVVASFVLVLFSVSLFPFASTFIISSSPFSGKLNFCVKPFLFSHTRARYSVGKSDGSTNEFANPLGNRESLPNQAKVARTANRAPSYQFRRKPLFFSVFSHARATFDPRIRCVIYLQARPVDIISPCVAGQKKKKKANGGWESQSRETRGANKPAPAASGLVQRDSRSNACITARAYENRGSAGSFYASPDSLIGEKRERGSGVFSRGVRAIFSPLFHHSVVCRSGENK